MAEKLVHTIKFEIKKSPFQILYQAYACGIIDGVFQ